MMCRAISGMPMPCLAWAKMTGPPSLILLASRSITSKSEPTAAARSVLLMISKSLWVMPGPPLRGILSPPAVQIDFWIEDEWRVLNVSTLTGNVDDVNDEIGQLSGEVGRQVVSAGFQQDEIGLKSARQLAHFFDVLRVILADGGVWTPTSFHSFHAFHGQGSVAYQELVILSVHTRTNRAFQ